MPIEPVLIIELALLGLATGFLAGLLGIGGGAPRMSESLILRSSQRTRARRVA